ncbi:MAG: response regulator [Chitinophagaceae bacterium]
MIPINTLLLIDDDTTLNFLHTKLIERARFAQKVIAMNYANIALDELKKLLYTTPDELPEIIVLDLNMPYMDGWEFLNEFKKFPEIVQQKCKIFILTSSINPNDIEKSKSYKVVQGFISKPLTTLKLMSLID